MKSAVPKKPPQKRVVCIGGGTGTFVVLRGLKQYPVDLSAVVSMSDSGGSNRRIRDEFGMLPTSDIRQCLVALSDENGGAGLMRKLFMYRFEKGQGIAGMTFGNLFMAALTDIAGSQEEAIRQTHKVLRIKGAVIPVTMSDTNLYATYEDGSTVAEEHLIDEPEHDGTLRITGTYLKPDAVPNPAAVRAITSADMIVIGPGDLYTSVIPNLLVPGIADALAKSPATVVYVMNLMTKYGQTYNFTASDHIRVLEETIGSKVIDTVVVNTSSIPQKALDMYRKSHEIPVRDDLGDGIGFSVVRAGLVTDVMHQKQSSDALIRSLIRHDSAKLADVLFGIMERSSV